MEERNGANERESNTEREREGGRERGWENGAKRAASERTEALWRLTQLLGSEVMTDTTANPPPFRPAARFNPSPPRPPTHVHAHVHVPRFLGASPSRSESCVCVCLRVCACRMQLFTGQDRANRDGSACLGALILLTVPFVGFERRPGSHQVERRRERDERSFDLESTTCYTYTRAPNFSSLRTCFFLFFLLWRDERENLFFFHFQFRATLEIEHSSATTRFRRDHPGTLRFLATSAWMFRRSINESMRHTFGGRNPSGGEPKCFLEQAGRRASGRAGRPLDLGRSIMGDCIRRAWTWSEVSACTLEIRAQETRGSVATLIHYSVRRYTALEISLASRSLASFVRKRFRKD